MKSAALIISEPRMSEARSTWKGREGKRSSERPSKASTHPTHPVVLRLPEKLLNELDAAVEQRSVRIPRHTWLLEAIAEKLEREQASQGRRHGT